MQRRQQEQAQVKQLLAQSVHTANTLQAESEAAPLWTPSKTTHANLDAGGKASERMANPMLTNSPITILHKAKLPEPPNNRAHPKPANTHPYAAAHLALPPPTPATPSLRSSGKTVVLEQGGTQTGKMKVGSTPLEPPASPATMLNTIGTAPGASEVVVVAESESAKQEKPLPSAIARPADDKASALVGRVLDVATPAPTPTQAPVKELFPRAGTAPVSASQGIETFSESIARGAAVTGLPDEQTGLGLSMMIVPFTDGTSPGNVHLVVASFSVHMSCCGETSFVWNILEHPYAESLPIVDTC